MPSAEIGDCYFTGLTTLEGDLRVHLHAGAVLIANRSIYKELYVRLNEKSAM